MFLSTCNDLYHQNCEFFRETKYTARKEYRCYECGRIIQKGEIYRYCVGKWDNNFDAYRMCLDCKEDWCKILEIFITDGKEDVFTIFGKLKEAVLEAIKEEYLEKEDELAQKWLSK